jgi:hypothetical protein
MAHADQPGPLDAQRGSFGLPQPQGASDDSSSLQLDMFDASPRRSGGSNLGSMRAELLEILGTGAASPEPPGHDPAQLRLAFLRAELARLDAA